MSIEIGPQTIKGEAEYHHQQQQARRQSRKNDGSTGSAIVGFIVIAVAFVAFLVVRNVVIGFWESLPF